MEEIIKNLKDLKPNELKTEALINYEYGFTDAISLAIEVIKNHGVSHHVSESLLEKYMTHVAHCEGVNFIDDLNTGNSDVKFTDEEVETLNRLNYSR